MNELGRQFKGSVKAGDVISPCKEDFRENELLPERQHRAEAGYCWPWMSFSHRPSEEWTHQQCMNSEKLPICRAPWQARDRYRQALQQQNGLSMVTLAPCMSLKSKHLGRWRAVWQLLSGHWMLMKQAAFRSHLITLELSHLHYVLIYSDAFLTAHCGSMEIMYCREKF